MRPGRVAAAVCATLLVVVLGLPATARWLVVPAAQNALDVVAVDPRVRPVCRDPGLEGGASDPAPPAGQQALPVTSTVLRDCPRDHDGVVVRLQGEVIGPLLRRSGGTWLFLDDGAGSGSVREPAAAPEPRGGNAGIAVLAPPGVHFAVVGGPGVRGDLVDVVGRFHRVDAAGELAVVHASAVEQLRAGGALPPPATGAAGPVAAVVGLLVVAVWLPRRRAS